jgi:NADH:ubiquinone oxidoreductase subunit 6 (subunit J)
MDRLRRDHSRELVGAAFVVLALVALVIGYANIRDEAEVAIQLPYILTGGIGALVLTLLGVAVLRSQDDKAILDRLTDVESLGYDLKEQVVFLNRLLEAGLLPDESVDVAKR